jgi:hypothetical protein
VQTSKVATLFQGELATGARDDGLPMLREECARVGYEEPGTEIHAFQIEEPDVIFVYSVFANEQAQAESRSLGGGSPGGSLSHLFRSVEEVQLFRPHVAKGIDFSADGHSATRELGRWVVIWSATLASAKFRPIQEVVTEMTVQRDEVYEPQTLVQAMHFGDAGGFLSFEVYSTPEGILLHRMGHPPSLSARLEEMFVGRPPPHECSPLFAKGLNYGHEP